MGDFFKPWRRKIGVVTLGLALLFMAGWVRSLSRCDTLFLNFGINSRDGINRADLHAESTDGYIFWAKSDDGNFAKPVNVFEWDVRNRDSLRGICSLCPIKSYLIWLTALNSDGTVRFRIFRYSSAVVPLTLISLWLLLSKPRQSTPKKIIEPTGNDGT